MGDPALQRGQPRPEPNPRQPALQAARRASGLAQPQPGALPPFGTVGALPDWGPVALVGPPNPWPADSASPGAATAQPFGPKPTGRRQVEAFHPQGLRTVGLAVVGAVVGIAACGGAFLSSSPCLFFRRVGRRFPAPTSTGAPSRPSGVGSWQLAAESRLPPPHRCSGLSHPHPRTGDARRTGSAPSNSRFPTLGLARTPSPRAPTPRLSPGDPF